MQYGKIVFLILVLLVLFISACNALDCSNPPKTIDVDHSRPGSFKTIQSAIDSIPKHNNQWIHIQISAGTYVEKVQIRGNTPCIFLQGAGSSSTFIQWSDHARMSTTPTFDSLAVNIVAKGITFENLYNRPPSSEDEVKKGNVPALAVKVQGDQNAFFDCAFKGVQDTLYDRSGRHYFYNCYIQGGLDFIFGNGQSIYEKCTINYTMGADGPEGLTSFITAQGREFDNQTSGFVFKECNITGVGKAYLGRAYRAYSRVVIANSYLSGIVDPNGWSPWMNAGHEGNLTYVEEGCTGPGADKSKRVPWLKHMDDNELNKFLSISYINQGGWLSKLPINL